MVTKKASKGKPRSLATGEKRVHAIAAQMVEAQVEHGEVPKKLHIDYLYAQLAVTEKDADRSRLQAQIWKMTGMSTGSEKVGLKMEDLPRSVLKTLTRWADKGYVPYDPHMENSR